MHPNGPLDICCLTNKVQVSKGKGPAMENIEAAYVRTLTRETNVETLVDGHNAVKSRKQEIFRGWRPPDRASAFSVSVYYFSIFYFSEHTIPFSLLQI